MSLPSPAIESTSPPIRFTRWRWPSPGSAPIGNLRADGSRRSDGAVFIAKRANWLSEHVSGSGQIGSCTATHETPSLPAAGNWRAACDSRNESSQSMAACRTERTGTGASSRYVAPLTTLEVSCEESTRARVGATECCASRLSQRPEDRVGGDPSAGSPCRRAASSPAGAAAGVELPSSDSTPCAPSASTAGAYTSTDAGGADTLLTLNPFTKPTVIKIPIKAS